MIRYFYVLSTFLLLSGCVQTTIPDQSNESIPNYSITLEEKHAVPATNSKLIVLDDNLFLVGIQLASGDFEILELSQEFEEDTWSIEFEAVRTELRARLCFFEPWGDDYMLGYIDDLNQLTIELIDTEYQIIEEKLGYNSFIATHYNAIDDLIFYDVSAIDTSAQVLLGGSLSSHGEEYSCVLRLDTDLAPIDVNTYFVDSYISAVHQLSPDRFLVLNSSTTDTDLILDSQDRSGYKKYDLSMDQLFFSNEIDLADDQVVLTGVENDIGKTITVNLSTETAFVNDAELYPVSDLQGVFLTRDRAVVSGIQNEGTSNHQWISELGASGSIWCHRYLDANYQRIMDIQEMPGKGILVLSLVENQGVFNLHLTRIDEEGATFTSNYTEICL